MPKEHAPKYLIYGLVDPRNGLIHYIGKSSTGMKRPQQHGEPNSLRLRTNRAKNDWIKSLLETGLSYSIVVLDSTAHPKQLSDLCWWWTGRNSTEINQLERWWIAYGRACGWPLTNTSDGGEGVTGRRSKEAVAKMKVARRRPEYRQRMRELATGRKHTEETKQLISAKKTGFKHSPETKAKMSASHIGKKIRRTKPSHWKGKRRSPETIEKMRIARLGKKMSPESSEKKRVAMKALGENHHMKNPEVRIKSSATRKRSWARKILMRAILQMAATRST